MDFKASEARDALRGVAVPKSLGRKVMRLCVIRGIRYHEKFARDPEFDRLRTIIPEFSRALNARAIMSNAIPSISADQDIARACAIAGCTTLYQECHVLPEVTIAEEARASGSQAIFDHIMSHNPLFRIMDDYTRAISFSNPRISSLNGDTAFRSSLDLKQRFIIPRGQEQDPFGSVYDGEECDKESDSSWGDRGLDSLFPEPGFRENMFNITEDMNIDEAESEEEAEPDFMADYLIQPLPYNLPPGNKDVLILMVAYTGNVDRWSKAKLWWSNQPRCNSSGGTRITQAIHARMITNNDLSRLVSNTQSNVPVPDLPYLIWYPTLARSSTYEALAGHLPQMRPSLLRAAVLAKDRHLFDQMLDEFGVSPDVFTLQEVKRLDIDIETPSCFTKRLLARVEMEALRME
ncbi:hypothetical protein V8C37DRAFT_408228 [Trichoderma ceciliae]